MECRTCPYKFVIDSKYYDRKEMKRKEVEDVIGGKDAWENVDKTDGTLTPWASRPSYTGGMECGCRLGAMLLEMTLRHLASPINSNFNLRTDLVIAAQCPREGCDGFQAFFYQIQIRSADEPMTTFYKVRPYYIHIEIEENSDVDFLLVYYLRATMERKLIVHDVLFIHLCLS